MPDNVVLIGFSGTGKSTVARSLAARLGWDVVDTDQVIVDRLGKSIAALFRDAGEQAFRSIERATVLEACQGSRKVVSVGGGAPVDAACRAGIRDGNFVVRLDAPAETILERLRNGPNAEERPMVAGADPLSRIHALLRSRADAYSIADLTVDTAGREIESVIDDIVRALPSFRADGGNG